MTRRVGVAHLGRRFHLLRFKHCRDRSQPLLSCACFLLHLVDLTVIHEQTELLLVLCCCCFLKSRDFRRVLCVPQGADELAEGGPTMRLVGPAAGQHGVHGGRAALRFGEPDTGLELVDHLPVLQPEERLLAHGEDLPHAHTLRHIQR